MCCAERERLREMIRGEGRQGGNGAVFQYRQSLKERDGIHLFARPSFWPMLVHSEAGSTLPFIGMFFIISYSRFPNQPLILSLGAATGQGKG